MIALLAAFTAGACGDPVVVLGDAPGIGRVVAGIADRPGSLVDSLATRTRLTAPTAVAFDESTGVLFFADRGATRTQSGITRSVGRIFAVRSDGHLSVLIDRGGCDGDVCLESPHSMIFTPNGDLFVSDVVGHRIFRIRTGTAAVEPVTGNGVRGHTPDGLLAAGASVEAPAGLTWVGGRLIFSELGGHRVRAIEADGTLRTLAGTGDPGDDGDGGPAEFARIASPAGLASNGSDLFIADRDNNRIRSVDLAGGRITTIAGTGQAGFAGDGGAASAARFDRPESVAVTADGGTLFVADRANDRVRVIDLGSGSIGTFAGTGDRTFVAGPRQAGEISLYRPAGLIATGTGFLFIADAGHVVVWRITVRI